MSIDLAYWNKLARVYGYAPQYGYSAYTTDCEDRERGYVDYFIIHHTATTSEAYAVALMQPGDSREVSAQWVLGTDGKFHPVVYLHKRAWTSASWLDDIADTVETVNVTAGPAWEISDLSTLALAFMAVWKFRSGRLKALTRQYIIGHYEVLGISGDGYTTACPGPDMQLDLIVELSNAIDKGLIGPQTVLEDDMAGAFFRNPGGGIYYQREPNTPLIGIDLPTWQGYAANGNKYVDLTQAAFESLRTKCGTATKPESTGAGDITVPPIDVGDVVVSIDYEALAKAIWDEQAKRIES